MKFKKLFSHSHAHIDSHDAKIAAQKFDAHEFQVLKKTWEDLAERNNNKGIDKETFLQYFPLNGLLGERLFAQFDKKHNNCIDFDEFITGLSLVCRGTMDEKIHFLFNMYDVADDKTVSKQELATLLNQIPKEALHQDFLNLSSVVPPQHPQLHHTASTNSFSNLHETLSDSDKSSISDPFIDASQLSDWDNHYADFSAEVDMYTNHDLVENCFNTCDINNEGRLSFEAFKMWVERNPYVLRYIESILPYTNPKESQPHQKKEEVLPHLKRNSSKSHLHERRASLTNSTKLTVSIDQPFSLNGITTPRNLAGLATPHTGPLSRNLSFSSIQSSLPSNIARATSQADSVLESEEQAKLYLIYALESTQNHEFRTAITKLIEQYMPEQAELLLNSPNKQQKDKAIKKGYLYKRGKSLFHLQQKRFYILSGNCLYYYLHQSDLKLKGVCFLTGSIVQKHKDIEMEMKGFYGFEILQQINLIHPDDNHHHHRHEKRVFFCRSIEEREEWITNLQHAAQVIPVEDDYVIGKELGRGRFSVVCECVHKVTGRHSAVKIINKSQIEPEEKTLLRTEIAVLKLVDHPNIIKLEGIYESQTHIYIVMEKLNGGELFERIVGRPRFSEHEAAKLMKPLLESVAYLHDLGIVHRDLKPENILCGEDLEDLKIADFGLSKMILPKEKMDTACGTLSYVAPEVLTLQGYGKEADLWSIGVILFLLLCGKLPFDGEDHNEIIRSTIQGDLKVNTNIWNKLSDDAKNLITLLLSKNPKDRITARDCLKHQFIINNCTPRMSKRNSIVTPVNPSGSGQFHFIPPISPMSSSTSSFVPPPLIHSNSTSNPYVFSISENNSNNPSPPSENLIEG